MRTRPLRNTLFSSSFGLVFGAGLLGSGSAAFAQDPVPVAPVEFPSAAAPADPYAPAVASSSPVTMAGPVTTAVSTTDHETVVRRWGVQVRRLATAAKTPGQDPACGKDKDCPVSLHSFGLRKWSTAGYAWNAGVALGMGGGASRAAGGTVRSWDTYFGFGPTFGASFLLANWKHLAVSAGPQLDLVFFMPSSSGAKTLMVNVHGDVEAEVHLGMIGLPAASVAFSTGIAASYRSVSRGKVPVDGAVARSFSLETTGPTALWDLVTQMSLRYYF